MLLLLRRSGWCAPPMPVTQEQRCAPSSHQAPFGPARGHRHRRGLLRGESRRDAEAGPEASALSGVLVYDDGPLRLPPGSLELAPSRPRPLAPRRAGEPATDRVPDPRRAHRGGPVRPAWSALYEGLREPRRLARDDDGQDRDPAPTPRRLGLGRAHHRARHGDRARPSAPRQAVLDRRRRGQLAERSLFWSDRSVRECRGRGTFAGLVSHLMDTVRHVQNCEPHGEVSCRPCVSR